MGIRIVAISGSLRRRSYNTALLRAAAEQAPAGVDVELWPIGDVPMYNGDVEAAGGFPEPVARLRAAVAGADGLLLASPEYNRSVTGALKNAVDWLSRGPDSPLDRKPAAILGGGGRSGTRLSQTHLRAVLRHNEVAVVADPEVHVARVRHAFDANLTLTDESVAAKIRQLVAALVDLIAERSTSGAD